MSRKLSLAIILICSYSLHAQQVLDLYQFYGQFQETATAIAHHTDGSVYIGGQYGGDIQLPNSSYSSMNNEKSFLIRISASGEELWSLSSSQENDSEEIITMDIDTAGNAYLLGRCGQEEAFTFGASNLTSLSGYWLAKVDANGQVLFLKDPADDNGESWRVELTDLDVAANGDFIVVGDYGENNALSFDNSVSVRGTPNAFDGEYVNNVFVILYGADGLPKWLRSSQARGDDGAEANSGHIDKQGNVYMIAEFTGSGSTDQDFDFGMGTPAFSIDFRNALGIAKYSNSGDFQWAKQISQYNDQNAAESPFLYYNYQVSTDPTGNVFVGGLYRTNLIIDADTLQAIGQNDFFLAKYNPGGQKMATLNLPTPGASSSSFQNGILNKIEVSQNWVYLAGFLNSRIVIGGDTLGQVSSGQVLIAGIATSLNGEAWGITSTEQGTSLSEAFDISMISKDSIYIAGTFNAPGTIGDADYSNITGNSSSSAFVLRLQVPTSTGTPDCTPNAAFSSDTIANNPLNIQFTDQSVAIDSSVTSWIWDFGDGNSSNEQNPTHLFAQGGVYQVSLIAGNGCGLDTLTQTLNLVCELPIADFTQLALNSDALTIQFADLSDDNVVALTSWFWNFGDGNSSNDQNPGHTYASSGMYTVQLIVQNACGADTVSKEVNASCIPTADFDIDTSQIEDFIIQFTDKSIGNTRDLSGWFWDFGDGNSSNEQNPIHTYADAGVYRVFLFTQNECGIDTTFKDVAIQCERPETRFGYVNSPFNALTVQFADSSLGKGREIESWLWDFGDGNTSTEQNPQHTFSVSGIYTVCLITRNACAPDTLCQQVEASCKPKADFIANSAPDNALSVQFVDQSDPNTQALSSWNWDFGDGNTSNEQNPGHMYTSSGTYTVSLITSNSCGADTTSQELTYTCEPEALFGASASSIDALTYQFTDSTNENSQQIDSWSWDFGDGNFSQIQNPIHTYAMSGTYSVSLIVSNACGQDTANMVITANCKPISDFKINSSVSDALSFQFADSSKANTREITSWFWDFGDGNFSNEQNPIHTYSVSGEYTVSQIVVNACGADTSSQMLLASCKPMADFSIDTSSVDALAFQFNDSSKANTRMLSSWFWDFGDGNFSTEQNPTHTYNNGGSYTVCLTVGNACGMDTVCMPLIADCRPKGAFSTDTSMTDALSLLFTDLSMDNTRQITGWVWDFGDGNLSTLQNPLHTYTISGEYVVSLFVSNVCGTDTVTQTVGVDCRPQAAFSAMASGSGALTLDFTDESDPNTRDLISWSWDFGDGTLSTQQNPSHTYAMIGEYEVSLIVNNECGADTIVQTVEVSCAPRSEFSYQADIDNPLQISFTDQTIDNARPIQSWFWDFGDGGIDSVQNPTYTFNEAGEYTVCLITGNVCGTDTVCNSVKVSCTPTAIFSYEVADTNSLSILFTDMSQGNSRPVNSWLWDFGDGNTSTMQQPSHLYSSAGSYTVCLVANNACGADTVCQQLDIFTTSLDGLAREGVGFSIYPNPGDEEFFLETDRAQGEVSIQMFTANGALVLEKSQRNIMAGERINVPTQSMPEGMYIILIRGKNGLQVERWIRK